MGSARRRRQRQGKAQGRGLAQSGQANQPRGNAAAAAALSGGAGDRWDRPWDELQPWAQKAWGDLGWDKPRWDGDRPPASAQKAWDELDKAKEQPAADRLGFNKATWNADHEITRVRSKHRAQLGAVDALDDTFLRAAAGVLDTSVPKHGDQVNLELAFSLQNLPGPAGSRTSYTLGFEMEAERWSDHETRLKLAGGLEGTATWSLLFAELGVKAKLGAAVLTGGEDGHKALTLALASIHDTLAGQNAGTRGESSLDRLFGKTVTSAFDAIPGDDGKDRDVHGKLDHNDWAVVQGEATVGAFAKSPGTPKKNPGEGDAGGFSANASVKGSIGRAYSRNKDGSVKRQLSTSIQGNVDATVMGVKGAWVGAKLQRDGEDFLTWHKLALDVPLTAQQVASLGSNGPALLLGDTVIHGIEAAKHPDEVRKFRGMLKAALGGSRNGALLALDQLRGASATYRLELRYDHWATGRRRLDLRLKRVAKAEPKGGSKLSTKLTMEAAPALIAIAHSWGGPVQYVDELVAARMPGLDEPRIPGEE